VRSSAIFASESMTLAGSFAGILSRVASAVARARSALVIVLPAAGISFAFLAAAGMAGSASMTAMSSRAAASVFWACRTAGFPVLRAGLSMILVLVSMAAM